MKLNVIRGNRLLERLMASNLTHVVNINETLGAKDTLSRPDIAEFVHEAKVDLDLWFE